MANALSTEIPPAPQPGMSNALTSGAAPAPGGNALSSGAPPAAGGAQGQPQAAPAPPTHAQMIAALRHFDAIRSEIEIIAKDPALGKSSVKSQIIDGVKRLVGSGIMTPTAAIDELLKVPQEPLLQMKWAKSMLAQTRKTENGILDHYGMSTPHLGTVADHFAATKGMASRDDHRDHMTALSANYGGKR